MQLYYHPDSTFSRRVRMMLLEKGLTAELVQLDFPNQEHKGAAYTAKNPYGRVPTLVDGDYVLYESTAILEYLEALHPTPPMIPREPRARGRCAMLVKVCDLEIGIHTRALIWPSRFLPRERWHHDTMEACRELVRRNLAALERDLDGPWLLGDDYTIADVCYTPFAQFWPQLEIEPPPRVAAWTERLLTRPSAQATVPSR